MKDAGPHLRRVLLSGLAFVTAAGAIAAPTPLPEWNKDTIGYATVAEALAGLRKQPGITFNSENGWLIATDEATFSIWSFAPDGYPAYPAVVKRQAVEQGHGSVIHMSVLCEAPKAACDDLVRAFQALLP